MPAGGQVAELRGGPGFSENEFQIRAALFADGSVFGDAEWGGRILRRRQYAEKEYRTTAKELSTAGVSVTSVADLINALGQPFKARLAQATDPDQREWISRIHSQLSAKLAHRFPDGKATSDGIAGVVSGLEAAAARAAGK